MIKIINFMTFFFATIKFFDLTPMTKKKIGKKKIRPIAAFV